MRYRKDLGDFGEKVAEQFLEKIGYRILKRKYTIRGGELDLIAETEGALIFIEVKTRATLRYGAPAESIRQNKIRSIRRAAERYLAENPTEKEIQFDVVEVLATLKDGFYEIENIHHIPNVWMEESGEQYHYE